jgi:hypothetical protein
MKTLRILGVATISGLLSATIAVAASTVTSAVNTTSDELSLGNLRADPLMIIDTNRTQVIDRIMNDHAQAIAGLAKLHASATTQSFRAKLEGLRADRLLAASLSADVDGVLNILGQQDSIQSATGQKDSAKAISSLGSDLTYTPITPCRLLDTRGVFSPQYSGGAFTAGQTRTYNVKGPAGTGCGFGTVAPRAVVLQAITIQPAAAGDLEILRAGATFGSTVAMVFQAGVFSSVSIVVPTSISTFLGGTDGEISVQVRSTGAHVALDIVGYYAEPINTTLDCFTTAAVTEPTGLTAGSRTTLVTDRCDTATNLFLIGSDNANTGYRYRAVSANCRTPGSQFITVQESYTEVFTTGTSPFTVSGERAVCSFANNTASNSNAVPTATAKCCRVPGR